MMIIIINLIIIMINIIIMMVDMTMTVIIMSILSMNDVDKHECNEDDLIASNFPSEDTNLASMVSIAKYSFNFQ